MKKFIGTRAYDVSMIRVEDNEGGFIGGVLIGLGGEIKGVAPAIGWSDTDVLSRLPGVQGVVMR